ncbi:hypothetical protein JCM9279_000451 [Rhodotorula babjevae]
MLLPLVAAATLLALSSALSLGSPASRARSDKLNIVFMIVDDQDARQNSIDSMPHLQQLLINEGTKFTHFYAPISVCCPSRSSFLRAQCAHNTNITSVQPPFGGWTVFNDKGLNGHYLPSFLRDAGYDVRYTGKLMNGHGVSTFSGELEADGFVDHAFLLDPHTYDYDNPAFSRTNGTAEYRPGEYSTDLVAEKALVFLDDAAQTPDKPFFLGVAPIAPHSHISSTSQSVDGFPLLFDLPRPAARHAHLFKDATLNYSRASFNPDVPSGASWVRHLDKLDSENVKYIEDFYRARLQSLQAVDELVASIVNKLEELGKLDETLIVYTSDNGFEANAGHRRQPGKTLPYEEDINVPLIVRGPGVARGLIDSSSVYTLADLGATILHLAGAQADYEHDGALVPLTASLRDHIERVDGAKHVSLSEYWVEGIAEGKYGSGVVKTNQTYRALRVVEGEIDYSYAVWCTGEREIYDMSADPDQMHNLALAPVDPSSFTARLHTRLDALLLVLKSCSGDSCRDPWRSLFPAAGVRSLAAALDKRFDEYFADLPRECRLGFHRKLEAPFWTDGLAYGRAGPGAQLVLSV